MDIEAEIAIYEAHMKELLAKKSSMMNKIEGLDPAKANVIKSLFVQKAGVDKQKIKDELRAYYSGNMKKVQKLEELSNSEVRK
jgi:hypothetical protein